MFSKVDRFPGVTTYPGPVDREGTIYLAQPYWVSKVLTSHLEGASAYALT